MGLDGPLQVGAPVMGVSLLLALAVFATGLWRTRRDPVPPAIAPEATGIAGMDTGAPDALAPA